MTAEDRAPEPPQKYFADQLDDEEVLFVFRKHPIIMRKGLVFGMLGPLFGVIPAAIWPSLGFGWFFGGLAGGFVLGGLILLPSWIHWYYSVFIVTDQRLIQITQKGLFHRSFVDLSLNQIQSLNYEVAGLQATLLGYGTILVQTYMGDLVVHDIHHPAKIYKKLVTILRENGVSTAPMGQSRPTVEEEAEGSDEEIEIEEA
jgi:uncharacterized membrane protein YdbT with pleckstrin-like domain